jgi:hypothetical protein
MDARVQWIPDSPGPHGVEASGLYQKAMEPVEVFDIVILDLAMQAMLLTVHGTKIAT